MQQRMILLCVTYTIDAHAIRTRRAMIQTVKALNEQGQ
jgi:hypothetical protein